MITPRWVCGVDAHQVVDIERGLAEEFRAALVFKHEKLTLHCTDRGHRNVAVTRADVFRIFRKVSKKFAQILEVDESVCIRLPQLRIVIGKTETDIDDAFLHVVEFEHARDQERTHLEHIGADRMTLLAEQIPEHDREIFGLIVEA